MMPQKSALFAVCLLCSGCAWWNRSVPLPPVANPVPTLHEVSMVPVGAASERASESWTERLRNALLRVEGIDRVHVIPPEEGDAAAGEDPFTMALARQCLLEVNVLEFDAYYPPSALVEVNFYLPSRITEGSWDPLTLDRLGTAPGSSDVSDRGPWLRFQKRYSADDHSVMESIRAYAASAGDEPRGFDRVDRILRISDRFMDFVLYETLKECFSRMDTKEEESDGVFGKLLDGRTGR